MTQPTPRDPAAQPASGSRAPQPHARTRIGEAERSRPASGEPGRSASLATTLSELLTALLRQLADTAELLVAELRLAALSASAMLACALFAALLAAASWTFLAGAVGFALVADGWSPAAACAAIAGSHALLAVAVGGVLLRLRRGLEFRAARRQLGLLASGPRRREPST